MKRSKLCIAGFIVSLISGILGFPISFFGLKECKTKQLSGKGFGIAGLLISGLKLVLLAVLFISAIVSATKQMNTPQMAPVIETTITETTEYVDATTETSNTDASVIEPTNSEETTETSIEETIDTTTQAVNETEPPTAEEPTEVETEPPVVEEPTETETEPPETTEEPVVEDTPTTTYVYITASGSCYHSSSTCSNMNNPQEVTLDYAETHGYKPCSKCW